MAAASGLPEPPAQLKAVHPYMRTAQDVERVDPVVAYWVRLYSLESALKIDKDSPECKSFLTKLLIWLEEFKQSHKDNDAVSNQTVGQAHVENFVVALFNKADTQDREGSASKNTIRMFYMAAVLFESMVVFGPLTEEVAKKSKYAKFKAAYIAKCLKAGVTPKPGPVEETDLAGDQTADESSAGGGGGASGTSSGVLNIPEVPTDTPTDSQPQQPTKPDPYVMTPSAFPPPSVAKPQPSASISQPTPAPSAAAIAPIIDQTRSTLSETRFLATNGQPLKPEDILLSQKFCKFANSALQYDDIPTAVDNLQKALKLLTTGQ